MGLNLGGRLLSDFTPSERADLTSLLLRVRDQRDVRAFTCLYQLFFCRLRAFLTRLGPAWLDQEALTHEVMILIWTRASSFDPARASALPWIYAIARNKRIDLLRIRKPTFVDIDYAMQVHTDAVLADDALARLGEQRRTEAACRALPRKLQEAVRLVYFEDLSQSEAAKRAGVPLGTLKSRNRLAMALLKKSLSQTISANDR